jgi:FAD/FMN-containing dehydrogenase
MALDDAVARELRALLGDAFVLTEPEQLRELGGKALDPDGYDVLGAFVGSEGTLGIATRITGRKGAFPAMGRVSPGGEVPAPYRMHPLERIGVVERF